MTHDPISDTARVPGLEALSARWKTLVILGVVMIVLSIAAFVMIVEATVASVLFIGSFMALIGIAEIVLAFQARTWGRVVLWLIAGAFYLLAGAVTLAQPLIAAAFFTLFLGAGLIATGVIRLLFGLGLVGAGAPRGMVILASVVTLLLGLLIIAGWPANSLIILGALLAFDLLFYGIAWLSVGLALRHRHGI